MQNPEQSNPAVNYVQSSNNLSKCGKCAPEYYLNCAEIIKKSPNYVCSCICHIVNEARKEVLSSLKEEIEKMKVFNYVPNAEGDEPNTITVSNAGYDIALHDVLSLINEAIK